MSNELHRQIRQSLSYFVCLVCSVMSRMSSLSLSYLSPSWYRTGAFRKHRQPQTLNFDDADDGDHGEEKETVEGNLWNHSGGVVITLQSAQRSGCTSTTMAAAGDRDGIRRVRLLSEPPTHCEPPSASEMCSPTIFLDVCPHVGSTLCDILWTCNTSSRQHIMIKPSASEICSPAIFLDVCSHVGSTPCDVLWTFN